MMGDFDALRIVVLARFDWASLLVFIIPLVLWALNHWMSGAGEEKAQRGAAARRRRPVPERPQPQQVDDEVGEFLKRATRRRAEAAAGNQPPDRPPPPESRRLAAPLRAPEAEIVQTEMAELASGRRISDSVHEHLDTRKFDERSQRLAHLGPVGGSTPAPPPPFEHQLGLLPTGSLGSIAPSDSAHEAAAGGTAPQGPSSAAAIVDMLTQPASMANAIVLAEILRRPEERW